MAHKWESKYTFRSGHKHGTLMVRLTNDIGTGLEICQMSKGWEQSQMEEYANLIAAAPELLEAAQEVEAAIQGLKLDSAMKAATDKLYAAIAKAEGRDAL